MSRYEDTFFSYFETIKNLLKIQPIVLGGGSGSNGGSGGPPGGFIGQLPQIRVAYDTTEAETSYTPPSGMSLLDNLNHIRARITAVQNTLSGISIKDGGVLVDSGITVLDFIHPLSVVSVSPNEVTVAYSGDLQYTWYSGIWNEIFVGNGSTQTFNTDSTIYDSSVRVFINGARLDPSEVTVLSNHTGFTLDTAPGIGDLVVVDYETPVPTPGHAHNEYRLVSDSYSIAESNVLFAPYNHTHVEADITDLSYNAKKIQGVTVSGIPPIDGQVLQFQASTSSYIPITIPGLSTQTIKQQMLLSIGGSLTTTGLSPLGVSAHDIDATINEIYIKLYSAPSSTPVRVSVLKNGINILNSPGYVEVAVGDTDTTFTSFSDAVITKNDLYQINLVQGDADASYLTVHIRFSWDL